MNTPSLILLAVIVAALGVALRRVVRNRGGCNCGCCSSSSTGSCPHCAKK